MPSLIGNKPNQVPSNGDLGTLAFQDASNVLVGNVNATGVTTVQSGTVSAPAITTTGDTNTGIFFPAADTIAFTEGGVESMRITSAGELLVGGATTLASGFSGFVQIEASGSSGGVLINSTAGNLGRLIFTKGNASGNEGLIRYDTNGYSMQFFTDAAERMRIDSIGNVGIGTSSPAEKLNVSGSGTQRIRITETGTGLYTQFVQSATNTGIVAAAPAATDNYITFNTTLSGSSAERMRITSAGNVSIGTTTANSKFTVQGDLGIQIFNTAGTNQSDIDFIDAQTLRIRAYNASGSNIVFGTNPNGGGYTERMRITSAGVVELAQGQIKFPATQVASANANTLDDYEEGTWTVGFHDASTAGNASATTTTGYYTKIGNIVTISCAQVINISTAGLTAGNTFYISLPFAIGSSANAVGTIALGNLDVSGTCTLVFDARANATRASILQVIDAAGFADTPVSALSSGVSDLVGFSLTYQV